MATTIEVHKQSVKQLLESGKENPFIIPEYQRPYAWTEEQVVTLFDDLWEFVSNENQGTYFLGSIVSYKNEDGEQEIIDGQQRITSLFLLLRAIYKKLTSTNEMTKEAKNFITQIEPAIWRTQKLTGEVDYSDTLLNSRVVTDKANFILKEILKTGEIQPNAIDSYSKNYLKFIELYEEASINNPLKIYEFIYTLLNKAILLPITADSQDTALTIFSTLNDRGLPLSDADIFKAKIYNNPIIDKTKFIEEWKELDEDAVYCRESIQQLFYYYMFYLRAIEKDNKTTTPGIRKYFSANKFIKLYDEKLLENLKIILNLWRVVNNKDEIEGEAWSSNIKIKQILDSLSSYPNEFWKYPVVIYYLTYRNVEDFEERFLNFLRKLFVELLSKYLETPTINAVKADILKLNVEIISSITPNFEFKNIDFEVLEQKIKNPHRSTVRMILKLLAYIDQEELLPDKWEVEHIFPQKWKTNYFNNISEDIIREKIEHIGNKIPFEKKLNIIAGNGYFNKKKSFYTQSKISIVKNIGELNINEWELDNISERDIRICDAIKNIFDEWNSNYINYNAKKNLSIPSDEEKAKIEEFRKKGWI